MATNDPIGTVRRMFAAFGAGDLDALLDTVNADTRWTYMGANPKPTKAELVGKAGVRRFFEGILRRLEMTTFEANDFIVEAETVVVFGGESGSVRATGEPFRNEWCQKVHGTGESDHPHGRVQRSGGAAMMSATPAFLHTQTSFSSADSLSRTSSSRDVSLDLLGRPILGGNSSELCLTGLRF